MVCDPDRPEMFKVAEDIRNQILVRSKVEVLDAGTLPRSFAKTKRVIDSRDRD